MLILIYTSLRTEDLLHRRRAFIFNYSATTPLCMYRAGISSRTYPSVCLSMSVNKSVSQHSLGELMALQLVHCKLAIICPTYICVHSSFVHYFCLFVFKVGRVCCEHCAVLTGSLSPAENSSTLCCQGRSLQRCRVPCGQGSTSQQQR